MMRYYCTLFDERYAAKGLALYESLVRWSTRDFRLYVLPMDGPTKYMLQSLKLPKMDVLSLEEFEHLMVMGPVKLNRTPLEYLWTCASNLAYYVMNWKETGCITYLDSDLYFFDDPERIFKIIDSHSIAIVPHRLIPEKQHLIVNGIYNVGWVTFRNDLIGRRCLDQWAADCRDWCYNRVEDGKFADQKYLDYWESKYGDAVCILEDISIGTAPWNVGNYRVTWGPCVNEVRIVFYHYHETQFNDDGSVFLTGYTLRDEDREFIYEPYVASVMRQRDQIEAIRNHTCS